MRIHIFGASGSGVSTLGNALSKKLKVLYYDSDDYFWHSTNPPFTTRRDNEERNSLIKNDLSKNDSWIFGGSSLKWGNDVFPKFDLIVFLWLPPEVRIERLKKRELERYGDIINTDPERIKNYQVFLEWAKSYDDDPLENGFSGRSLKVHEDWLAQVNTNILEIRGDFSVDERIDKIIRHIT